MLLVCFILSQKCQHNLWDGDGLRKGSKILSMTLRVHFKEPSTNQHPMNCYKKFCLVLPPHLNIRRKLLSETKPFLRSIYKKRAQTRALSSESYMTKCAYIMQDLMHENSLHQVIWQCYDKSHAWQSQQMDRYLKENMNVVEWEVK